MPLYNIKFEEKKFEEKKEKIEGNKKVFWCKVLGTQSVR